MRPSSQEIGKNVRLRDGEVGRVADILLSDSDFSLMEITIHTGLWPFSKDFHLPPEKVNFLKSGDDYVFVDLTEHELKEDYQIGLSQREDRGDFRADTFALEEPVGVPYSWSREDSIVPSHQTEGPVTGVDTEVTSSHPELIRPLSVSHLLRSEIYLDGDEVAEITEVLLDPVALNAPYCVCKTFAEDGHSTLLPLEWAARIDTEGFEVRFDGFDESTLNSAPVFEMDDVLNGSTVEALASHYGRAIGSRHPKPSRASAEETYSPSRPR